MTAADMRSRIEATFAGRGSAILSYLDEMDPRDRLNLLRDLLRYETERVRERIEDLKAILPLEDRP